MLNLETQTYIRDLFGSAVETNLFMGSA